MPQESKNVLPSLELSPVHPRVWDILDAIEGENEGDGVIPIVGQGLLVIQGRFDAAAARQAAGTPEMFDSIARVTKEIAGPTELLSVSPESSRIFLANRTPPLTGCKL